MYAYLVRYNQADRDDLRQIFGDNIFQGQTKQTDVTSVFSDHAPEVVKSRAALLTQRPDGQHRFDVASLSETIPL